MVKIDATGTGCIMYDSRVFTDEKIEFPWFETRVSDIGKRVGEDIGMCVKLKEAGYNIYVDTSITIGHIMLHEVDRVTHQIHKKINGGLKNG